MQATLNHFLKDNLNYSWNKGRADFIAALTVAAIALPQGIAYALIAGVYPRFGLYSAVFITAIASIFGSSSHLVNGPTSAISLVTIALALVLRKWVRRSRLPQMDMLVVLVIVSIAAYFLGWTIPNTSGKTLVAVTASIPASLPLPHIPEIKFGWIPQLSRGALAIAFRLIRSISNCKSDRESNRPSA